jgi:hypothetical protein
MFKARVYIHVQKQNHYDVGLEMMKELAQRLIDGVHNQKGLFESVVGQLRTHEKRWVLDVDYQEIQEYNSDEFLKDITEDINNLEPIGDKIIANIPTKNGYHLITKPFNVQKFRVFYPEKEVSIQKHNPTLLYYPNSLNNG